MKNLLIMIALLGAFYLIGSIFMAVEDVLYPAVATGILGYGIYKIATVK